MSEANNTAVLQRSTCWHGLAVRRHEREIRNNCRMFETYDVSYIREFDCHK